MSAPSILLVGCGNMGGAMLHRWVAAGTDPASITVLDHGSPQLPGGVRHIRDIWEGTPFPTAVVLAVKPQQLAEVMPPILGFLPGTIWLLVSILAGVEERTLQRLTGAEVVIRAMPNLPVAIGKGVTALHTTSDDARAKAMAESLAAPLGLVEWIADEALFNLVTALAGSGPAFVFRFIDALAEAGAALGLPRDQAARLALVTVEGAAAMAAGAGEAPAILADRVASPGGSTREGLNVLDRDGALRRLLTETLAASAQRNAELAKA